VLKNSYNATRNSFIKRVYGKISLAEAKNLQLFFAFSRQNRSGTKKICPEDVTK